MVVSEMLLGCSEQILLGIAHELRPALASGDPAGFTAGPDRRQVSLLRSPIRTPSNM